MIDPNYWTTQAVGMQEAWWPHGWHVHLWMEQSWFEPWPRTLEKHFTLTMSLSTQVYR